MTRRLLHLVSQSPFTHKALQQCLDHWQPQDGIVLLGDGVYGVLAAQPLATAMADTPCYFLEEDSKARGLENLPIISHCQSIDYEQMVALCASHDLVQSWY